MEDTLKELKSKMKTLQFRMNKTTDIVSKRDKEAMERQRLSVATTSTAVNNLKERIEDRMPTDGKTGEEVQVWSNEVEGLLAEADNCTRQLSKELKNLELAAQETAMMQEQQRKLQFEKELTEQRLHQEQEAAIERKKLDMEYHEKTKDVQQASSTNVSAKMPKLVITKFNGTPKDWIRFWGQFRAQIEESSVDPVTKFSYLKELVEMKVRKSIDGLPFTMEGYERAKEILEKKYGDTSEVVNAYVKGILELPAITERDDHQSRRPKQSGISSGSCAHQRLQISSLTG